MEEEDGQLGSGPACAKGICLQWYRWEGEEGKVLTKQNDGDRGGGERAEEWRSGGARLLCFLLISSAALSKSSTLLIFTLPIYKMGPTMHT